jgi:hypothetical protein
VTDSSRKCTLRAEKGDQYWRFLYIRIGREAR